MSEDATLDLEGAPVMDAPNAAQEPVTQTTEGVASAASSARQEGPLPGPGFGAPLDKASEDGQPKSPRELAIEAITASRMRDFAEETGVPIDADAPPERQGQAAERKIKLKVDGEDMEISEAELIKGYQKDATASRRLEQAAAESKRVQAEWID